MRIDEWSKKTSSRVSASPSRKSEAPRLDLPSGNEVFLRALHLGPGKTTDCETYTDIGHHVSSMRKIRSGESIGARNSLFGTRRDTPHRRADKHNIVSAQLKRIPEVQNLGESVFFVFICSFEAREQSSVWRQPLSRGESFEVWAFEVVTCHSSPD